MSQAAEERLAVCMMLFMACMAFVASVFGDVYGVCVFVALCVFDMGLVVANVGKVRR